MPRMHNQVDLQLIARRTAMEEGFITHSSLDVLEEVAAITRQRAENLAGASGRDMTELLWSSIDNSDSKDLDQIEYVAPSEEEIRVLIGIADVDAYVPKGSSIDKLAAANTTSVYTGVINFPMLPHELSEDITSLRQNVDRLAIVVDMLVAPDGSVRRTELYRAKVRNKAKLAYVPVGKWLDGEGAEPSRTVDLPGLKEQLQRQYEQSKNFKQLRVKQGALKLYTSESRAVVENGTVVDLIINEENPACELIETFMVTANTSIAAWLDEQGEYSIRRIVRNPKRWPRIVELAEEHGFSLPQEPDGHALSEFLAAQRLRDPISFPDLSLSIVKLLGRGEYVVVKGGKLNAGHFGLGLQDYMHSTAPNRRYPDLVTQRLLKALLDGHPCPYTQEELAEIAAHCTEREAAANKVERFMRKAAAAVLLADRLGEVFDGIVTGVKTDGTFVRIFKPSVEGRIVQKEHGLDVGQKVHVRLLDVDPYKGFIDFKRV